MPTIVDYLTGPLVILIEPQRLIARSAACKKDDLLLGLSDPCKASGGSLAMSRSPSSLRHGELTRKGLLEEIRYTKLLRSQRDGSRVIDRDKNDWS